MIETAVSAAAGGACAGSAAVLYAAEKLPGLNRFTNRMHTDRAQALLIMTASAALVSTSAGSWWNRTVNAMNDGLVHTVGSWTGILLTGFTGLAVLFYFINDLITRRVEHRTRVLGAILPVLAASIPGPIGVLIVAVLSGVVNAVGTLVSGAFGVA